VSKTDQLQRLSDPAVFRKVLDIETDAGLKCLDDTLDDWQRNDFEALDAGWKRVAFGTEGLQRAWLERGRGHSKSSDVAIQAVWCLLVTERPIAGFAGAGDLDQARILRDSIGRLLHANPWLSEAGLELQNYRVLNTRTGSTLEIISSDARTSYGLLPDFVICDELCHWARRDLWDSLFSSAAKRSTCMLVVITNAGLQDDWQWELREAVRKDPSWYFNRLEGPVASWISKEILAEQERLLPPIAFQRLWLNQWTSGGGDALSTEVINAAFRSDLSSQDAATEGFTYVAGLDLGVSRDASALVILGIRRSYQGHGMIRLAHVRVWRPSKGMRVDLQQVENAIVELHIRFNLHSIGFDPWQAHHMASRLQSGGFANLDNPRHKGLRVPMVEIHQTSANLQAQASTLIQSFNDHRVELFEHPDLRRDLHKLRIEEKSYGYRLVSPRDEHGHGDVASAFCLGLLAASELAAKKVATAGAIAGMGQQKQADPGEYANHMDSLHQRGADYSGHEGLREALYQASFGARGRFPFHR
jgi:phage terminase large subunit-like protein